jgi:hypothetical protein
MREFACALANDSSAGAYCAMYRCESASDSHAVTRVAGSMQRFDAATRCGARIAAWLGAFAVACGGAAATHEAAPHASEPELHRGELTDFVPAAGLRWLVVGSPRRLAHEPGLASLRQRWLTEDRRRAFALETGVDLFATERALAAGYDLGTLYMADASGFRARPEVAFARRLAGSERLRQAHPAVWHVTGLVGSEPEALVRVADVLVAVAVGDVTLARVVELRALGRLARTAPAFQGVSLSTLPAELLRPQAFAFYLPGPIEGSWLGSGAGLFGAAHALAATLALDGSRLTLHLGVAGSWHAADDAAELGAIWQGFAASTIGRKLALDRPLGPAELRGSERLLELDQALDAAAFSAGLEDLLVGNLDDLVEPR